MHRTIEVTDVEKSAIQNDIEKGYKDGITLYDNEEKVEFINAVKDRLKINKDIFPEDRY